MGPDRRGYSRARLATLVAVVFALGLMLPVVASSQLGGSTGAAVPAAKPCNATTAPANGRPPCATTTAPTGPTTPTEPTTPAGPTAPTGPTTPTPPPALRPVAGKTVVAGALSGTIFYRRPGAHAFARLLGRLLLPVGSTINATHGRLGLTSANGSGTQTGSFHDARFVITQARRVAFPRARGARAGAAVRAGASGAGWTTVLALRGGSFAGCDADDVRGGAHAAARAAAGPAASAAAARPRRRRRVRRLWSAESGGTWTTVGGYAAATVRGTVWLTEDRCSGTYVYVKRGVVVVRNLFTGRRVRLTAGHAYLARAPDKI